MSGTYAFGQHHQTDVLLVELLAEHDAFTGRLTDCEISDRQFLFEAYSNQPWMEHWAIEMLCAGYDSPQIQELTGATEIERERANRAFQVAIESLGLSDITNRLIDAEAGLVDHFLEGAIEVKQLAKLARSLDEWASYRTPPYDLFHNWSNLSETLSDSELSATRRVETGPDQASDSLKSALLRDRELPREQWNAARILTRELKVNSRLGDFIDGSGTYGSRIEHDLSRYRRWAKAMVQLTFSSPTLHRLRAGCETKPHVVTVEFREAMREFNLSHISHRTIDGSTLEDLLLDRFRSGELDAHQVIQAGKRLSERDEYYERDCVTEIDWHRIERAISAKLDLETATDISGEEVNRLLEAQLGY